MVRTIFFFISFGLIMLYSLTFLPFFYLLPLFKGIEGQKRFLQKKTFWWGSLLYRLTGSKIEIQGMENLPEDKNILFICNHQSYMDIPLILGHIPKLIGFVAKKELGSIPILNKWMKLLGCLFIDRNDLRQSSKIIEQGAEYLKSGDSLLIFPEGTRSKSSTMGRFKAGSFKLAYKSGVKVVPITIDGSYKVFEAKGRIMSETVRLIIHPFIDASNLSDADKEKFPEKISEIIKSGITQ